MTNRRLKIDVFKVWRGLRGHRRLRMRSYGQIALILVAALVIHLLDRQGLLLVSKPDLDQYHGIEARVVRVVDGDTLIVDLPDPREDTSTTRIRLWGIDSPEMARSGADARGAEPFAQEAADFIESRALDHLVRLRIERHRVRDRYDRILAYVELPDGSDLGEQLLLAGLTLADDRWPHTLLERYAQLETAARKQGQGLWER